MTPTKTPELLTADEVAGLLRVPRSTIYDWASSHTLPADAIVRLGLRSLRFDKAVITAWLASRQGGTRGKKA